MENWVNNFPKKIGLQPAACIGLAHHPSGKQSKNKSKPPKGMVGINLYDTSIEDGASTIHTAVDKYFANLMTMLYEKQEREENDLMKL